MSAYLVITYDVSDPDKFAEYSPGSVPAILATLAKHGGETVFAGPPEVVTGSTAAAATCVRFPDANAAKAWLADEDYATAKEIRSESTTNITEYIVPGFG